jgi:cation:H+ antiporter
MLEDSLILLASFVIIMLGSELFTNAVEWSGEKLGIAEAAVGSLLAAVGTALPETFVPAMALVFGRQHDERHFAVGIGAIIGAPLMLSTVALAVMGVAGIVYRSRRGRIALRVSRDDARRDLTFFIPVFLATIMLGLGALNPPARYMVAAGLLIIYVIYGVAMLRIERHPDSDVEHGLYLELPMRGDPMNPRNSAIAAQVVLGLVAIMFGAREFVDEVVAFSTRAHLNPGVLSLILSPLATELPEKYNSVVWIRQNKDHLALGNITGAMVFQSCIPVAIGLTFTNWHLSGAELLAGAVAIVSATLLYINLRDGELGTPTLMLGGAAYGVFLIGLALLGVL